MTVETSRPSYSANVRLALLVGHQQWELAAIGPTEFITRTPCDLAPCDAQLQVTIDEQSHLYDIHLPDGAVPFDDCIRVQLKDREGQSLPRFVDPQFFENTDWPVDLILKAHPEA